MVPMLVMQTTNEINQTNVSQQNKEAFYYGRSGIGTYQVYCAEPGF